MKQQTLLEGNIKKELILLALPLLAGNILQQFYNTADTLIIGRCLDTSAFASAGLSGTIMNLFIFVLNGFCVGVSMLFAKFYGMEDKNQFRREFFLALCAGLCITVSLSALATLFLKPLLAMMQTPSDIFPYCVSYLRIILAGLFATYLYNLLSGILRAVGNSAAALLFLLVSIVLNTMLDILFIAVFHMGISGAAYATVMAQLFSAICCFLYLKKSYPALLCGKADLGFHGALLKQTLCYGIVSALQQSSLYIGKLLVQGSVNTLGTASIASYTATMRVEGVVNAFSDSGSQSISILIAQNFGAGNKKRVHDTFHHGLLLMIAVSILSGLLMFASAPFCMAFLMGTKASAMIRPGISYLQIISIFYVLCYVGNSFVGLFRGTGKVSIPFIATTIHITLRVLCSHLLLGRLGLSAVALATGLGWICAVTVHLVSYVMFKKRI